MTHDQHKARHVTLHEAYNELLADYLLHHPAELSEDVSLSNLELWSYLQSEEPTETASEAAHAFAVCARCGLLVTEPLTHSCGPDPL